MKNFEFNGKLYGIFIEYYDHINGKILSKLYYQNNLLNGVNTLYYYSSGNIHKKCCYKNGKREGKFIKYHENGNIWGKLYYKNDNREGDCITYYENEKFHIKCNYKNDKIEGEYIEYDEDGKNWIVLLYK
jgi:antitoxin component YwqK of YwqJK toxin-antitoxin module